MALAFGTGPLSPSTDGTSTPPIAAGTTFVQPYRRRVRALVGGRTVVDTEGAVLLHAPGRLMTVWLPRADVDAAALPDAALRQPREDGPDLGDRVHLPFDAADRWFAEDEPVYAHFRDPYHRVDVLTSSRHVVVRVAGEVVAETRRPKLLFETALPVRYYVPWADTRIGFFERSDTVSECPYKGDGQHWHVAVGDTRVEDAAWSLPHPLPEGFAALEHVAFYADKVELEVDGRRVGD